MDESGGEYTWAEYKKETDRKYKEDVGKTKGLFGKSIVTFGKFMEDMTTLPTSMMGGQPKDAGLSRGFDVKPESTFTLNSDGWRVPIEKNGRDGKRKGGVMQNAKEAIDANEKEISFDPFHGKSDSWEGKKSEPSDTGQPSLDTKAIAEAIKEANEPLRKSIDDNTKATKEATGVTGPKSSRTPLRNANRE
jgi:hypothetical protein